MTRAAAAWAADAGRERRLLAVARANARAQSLPARLGFTEAGDHHYRRAPDDSV